jgi:sulfite reductase (NADPH) flavoprotein alpha-component
MRWFKNLHRSFLLGDGGRIAAALVALAMGLLAATGLVLLARRLGGWRQLLGRVRGTLVQRLHVVTGRVVLAVLLLTSVTALAMSAATFGWSRWMPTPSRTVAPAPPSPPTCPRPTAAAARAAGARAAKLNFPAADDPADTWQVTTTQGQGWIDRHSGQTLAWQTPAPPSASTTGPCCCTPARAPGPGRRCWDWPACPSRCSGPPA